MISISFLSQLDPRIKPAGSRDPLGFQSIWVNRGHELIGNKLTTITTSIDNFIITLLGCYFAFNEEENNKFNTFFKIEQLGAYFRLANNNEVTNVMGILKARENFDSKDDIPIGEGEGEIFTYQKTSGLWGYYTSSLKVCGLINNDKTQLEPDGHMIIEKFIKHADIDFNTLIRKENISKEEINKNKNKFLNALKHVYSEMSSIVLNSKTSNDVDYKVYDSYAKQFFDDESIEYKEKKINEFYSFVKKKYRESDFWKELNDIRKLDKALWLTSEIFEFLRAFNTYNVTEVADILKGIAIELNINDLENVLPTQLKPIFSALIKEDYNTVVTDIINLHKGAMKDRTAGSWVYIDMNNTIRVRVKSSYDKDKKVLKYENNTWKYRYFLDSYLNIAYQIHQEG